MSPEHPSWCSPAECHPDPAGHMTHSRTHTAQSPCGELTVSVHLEQDGNAPPTITLTTAYAEVEPNEPAAECEILFHPDLASEVGWLLLTTGRQAARHRTRSPDR
jgi:hypothetical protein